MCFAAASSEQTNQGQKLAYPTCQGTPGGTLSDDKKNDPNGTRTRVAGVKGRSPRPLDDGAAAGITCLPSSLEKFLRNRQVPSAKLLENGVDLHKTENRVQKYLALQYNDTATVRK